MLKSDEQTQPAQPEGLGAPTAAGTLGLAPTPAADLRRLPAADRSAAVTPLDMRQAKFGAAMRGFDRAEVSTFLLEAAEGYEQSLRENDRLRQEIARLEASLVQYRDLEGSLKSTLLTAQRTADDVRENAAQEAARIVREAEGRAELMLEKAQARMDEAQRDIDMLRLKRREAEANLESLVAAIRNTIAFIHEQEQREPPKAVGHHLQVVR
jgi:cell division initiation protein